MSGLTLTDEEFSSLVECFPSTFGTNGDGDVLSISTRWDDVHAAYKAARRGLRSTDPAEIGEITSRRTRFAKTMEWYERLLLNRLEAIEPSPDVVVATPLAALEWMEAVSWYLLCLAQFEAHAAYMIMLGAAPACRNGQRWLAYTHRLNGATDRLDLYFQDLVDFQVCFDQARGAGREAYGSNYFCFTLIELWDVLIASSERIARLGDDVHAMHEMVQDVEGAESPAGFPDDWEARVIEIYRKIDSVTW